MKKLSVLIPVYNEAPQLEAVFNFLFKSECPIEREWIVVDDSSTDGSRDILERLSKKFPFRLILHPKNRGKGAAIRTGLENATGDLIVIQDADFEYDPSDIPDLLKPILDNRADVVYGSRFKQGAPQVHRTYHYFVNRILTILSNLFSGIYLTDMETCYKVFRADIVRGMKLQSERFGIEIELTAYVAKTSARIFELPIHYYPRTYLQGKKIGWKDGLAGLWQIVKFNFFVARSSAFHDLPAHYASKVPVQRKPNTQTIP